MPANQNRAKRPPRSASRRKRERRRELARIQSGPGRGLGRRGLLIASGAAAVVVAVLVTILVTRGSGAQPGPPPASSTPVPTPTPPQLASLATVATGDPVDGIQCASSEVTTHKVDAHLAVFSSAGSRQVPAGVGIPSPSAPISTNAGPFIASGKCYYALLTHTGDGIIVAEPPTQTTYTLGDFFDIWGQPLSANQVGPLAGAMTAYVNGTQYTGDVRGIPITEHALIQLDVGSSTTPQPFTFPPGD